MNTCTHCRMEVPNMANKCPYCLENPYAGSEVFNNIISICIMGFIGFIIFSVIFG